MFKGSDRLNTIHWTWSSVAIAVIRYLENDDDDDGDNVEADDNSDDVLGLSMIML